MIAVMLLVGCEEAPRDEPVEFFWDTPMSPAMQLEAWDDSLTGVSLRAIVSGEIELAWEGERCTSCHFRETIAYYGPEVEQYGVMELTARDVVGGRSWGGTDGWAERYVALADGIFEKPPEMRRVFERWLEVEATWVEPLYWASPMTLSTLGVEPDPNLRGSLSDIVNSVVSGRPDGLLCSDCHYADGAVRYRPPVGQGAVSSFAPDDVVDGASWSGAWARRFVEHGPDAKTAKPSVLRGAFNKWMQDGATE